MKNKNQSFLKNLRLNKLVAEISSSTRNVINNGVRVDGSEIKIRARVARILVTAGVVRESGSGAGA